MTQPSSLQFCPPQAVRRAHEPGPTVLGGLLLPGPGWVLTPHASGVVAPRGKSLQIKIKNQSDFSLVATGTDLPLILSHLDDHKINYKIKFVYSLSYEDKVTNTYWAIWDFKGNLSAINQLRYIFD